MNTTYQNIPIRISISEAGKLFGISTKTIRLAIKNGEILYIIARGRYKLNFESMLAWSQNTNRRSKSLATQGIGQYVDKWHIHTKKYSPNPALLNQLTFPNKDGDTGNQANPEDHQSSENQSDL